MTTGLDLVTAVLQKASVYAPGEVIPDDDAQKVLLDINNMLDMWSNENNAVYATTTQNFQLVAGQSQYTIGSGGNINAPRPLRIYDDPGSVGVLDGSGFNYPVRVVGQFEWNQIAAKNLTFVQSTIALVIWYDPQYPLGVINVYPAPGAGFTMYFVYPYILSDLTLSTTLSLPQGYIKAITDCATDYTWPNFYNLRTDPVPPDIIRHGKESLAWVKRTNRKQLVSGVDPILYRGGKSTYNIYIDAYANQS